MPPQRRVDRKSYKARFDEVETYVRYLDRLIKDRTTGNQYSKAVGIAKPTLEAFLDGTDVPALRVLVSYLLKPLTSPPLIEGNEGASLEWDPLTDEEYATLLALHHEAVGAQPAKEYSDAQRLRFLQEDLTHYEERVSDLSRSLDNALYANRILSMKQEQTRTDNTLLREKLEILTAHVGTLQSRLRQIGQECQALRESNERLAEVAEQKTQELELCQRKLDSCQEQIRDLEKVVSEYAETDAELRRRIRAKAGEADALKEENHSLRRQMHEQRLLFMRLVAHASGGQVLTALNDRLELSEKTIASLAGNNKTLSETVRGQAVDLDHLKQERDFAYAALRAAEERLTELTRRFTSG